MVALLTLIAGLAALAGDRPLLFPSLGPTAFLRAEASQNPQSSVYNTVAGHLIGIFSAFVALSIFAADDAPAVLQTGDTDAGRIWASVLALALLSLLQRALRAAHPPAAATVLLITLGGFGVNWEDAGTIMGGVLLITLVSEPLRRFRPRSPTVEAP